MRAFKFMDSNNIDSFLAGKIRLCTLDYYRQMETDNEWIKDSEEGVEHILAENFSFHESFPNAERDRYKLMQLGVEIAGANLPVVRFSNSTFKIQAPTTYIFCVSGEPFDSAAKAMCIDAPVGYRYDSCVEIDDLRTLKASIQQSWVSLLMKFPLVFFGMDINRVSYEKRPMQFSEHDSFGVDPFSKPERFRTQQEIRFVLRPKIKLPSCIFLNFDPPKGLLRRVDVPGIN